MTIRYQGPIKAPIRKGQHVADLLIHTGNTAPQVMPLVAASDVEAAGLFGRMWLGFKQLCGMA
jgi:D-alanyl-D-alanine carboxypeptidase (penicillin-binding protein 5/6)